MTRREEARSMQQFFGKGFLTVAEVARYIGVSRGKAEAMLAGADYIIGAYNTKQYSVSDIAERIMQKRG